jgi:hypothetical protein
MQGAHWSAGRLEAGPAIGHDERECAYCEARLGEVRLLLVRHRGEHRIADGFCSTDHLAQWAKAGGRWR